VTEKKQTKYDKLVAVNQKLAENFSKIDHPNTQLFAKLFGRSGPGLWEEVKKKDPSVTRSQIAAGLEQGLRDLSMMVAGQPEEVRSAAISAYRDAILAEYPDFVEKDKQRLAKVLERGSVRSESEWYLLQHRVDEIEGTAEHEEELGLLYKMMDDYGSA
jgi:hypothetical protein